MELKNRKISSYRDLIVWQKSVDLVTEIYAATSQFPRAARFRTHFSIAPVRGLGSQQHRRGPGRATEGEFVQFLSHARGSLFELETQVWIAKKLGYLSPDSSLALEKHAEEVARILNGLLTSLGVGTRKLSTIH